MTAINPTEIQSMKQTIHQQSEQLTALAETMQSMAKTQVELAKSNQATVEALQAMATQTKEEDDHDNA